MPSILVIDDHAVARLGMVTLVSSGAKFEKIYEAASITEARKVIGDHEVDLVITDLTLPDGNGIDFTAEMTEKFPAIRFLVLSMHDERIFAERALKAGASGYLMKDEAYETIRDAAAKVLQGDLVLSDTMQKFMMKRLRGLTNSSDGGLSSFANS